MSNSNAFHYLILDLISEIKAESILLEAVYSVQKSNLKSSHQIDRLVAQSSLASIVAKIYTKSEDVFSKITKEIDGESSSSDGWHASLLRQVKLKTDQRPAVLSLEAFKLFDLIRKFRHAERNCYASDILPSEIPEKVDMTLRAVELLEKDYRTFAAAMFKVDSPQLKEPVDALVEIELPRDVPGMR
jgi:hypothetical protein